MKLPSLTSISNGNCGIVALSATSLPVKLRLSLVEFRLQLISGRPLKTNHSSNSSNKFIDTLRFNKYFSAMLSFLTPPVYYLQEVHKDM